MDPDAWYTVSPERMGPEAYADLRRALHDPEVVHGMLEDYRAGLGDDRDDDAADRAAERKISCPTLVVSLLRKMIRNSTTKPTSPRSGGHGQPTFTAPRSTQVTTSARTSPTSLLNSSLTSSRHDRRPRLTPDASRVIPEHSRAGSGSTLVSPPALWQGVGVTDSASAARIVPANKASWDDLRQSSRARAVTGDAATASASSSMGPRGPATRSIARTCCASKAIAGIRDRPRQAALSLISMVSRPGGATWSRAPRSRISVACLGGNEKRTGATPASGPCRASSPAQGSVAAASATRLHAPPWTSRASAEPVPWRAIP